LECRRAQPLRCRKDPTPLKTVEAIIKAREAGKMLRAIAEHYGLSESSISRIVKKNRRANASV
jgi:Mor family transcriptional regulator